MQTRPSGIPGSAWLLAAWTFLAPAAPTLAHELKDIALITAGGQTQLRLTFAADGSEGDYPLYFQKSDPAKSSIVLSFLETETAFPLGRKALEPNSPDLEEIILKKVTTPSGKNFLGLEMKYRRLPEGDAVLQPAPKGVLKVMLGKGKGKYDWSWAASLKAGDAYLSAKAEVPPAGSKAGAKAAAPEAAREEAPAAEPVTPTIPSEPAIPGHAASGAATEPADAAAAKPVPGTLAEAKLIVTSAQANLALVFNPPAAPNYAPRRNARDSSWLELVMENTVSAMAKKDYVLPKNPIYKRIKTVAKGDQLVFRIQLSPDENVDITPQADGLAISALIKGPPAPAFKWTSLKPESKESENVAESGEPVKSAFEEGEALEAVKTGKALSSSKTFTFGRGSKTMVLLKDSAALRSEPGAKGTVIKKIPIGERLQRIATAPGGLRVVSGSDTGYIRAAEAVYEDELTQAQETGIQKRIEANQARIAAAEAKAAAAEARAAELKAKQEEKARKAEELALKKAAEKAAADSLRALAKAEAQAKADAKAQAKAQAQALAQQRMQEAQAPAAVGAATAKNPAGAPNAGPAGQAGAGEPKLAIADNPELAAKLAREKLEAEEEKKRIEPEENRVSYNSYGRRDPFIPVEQGSLDNGIDIDQMKVVGIIWQATQPMAVLEHNREAGVSFTIKEGDPVHNGRVARITRDAVTFDISEYGISRSYSLKLVSSKEGARK
jgi:hypothetical protein